MSTQAISAAQQYGSDPFCRASEGVVLGTASPRHKQHATSHDHCLHRRAALRICSRARVCSFTDRCERGAGRPPRSSCPEEGAVLGTASPRHEQHATSLDDHAHRRAAPRVCSLGCVSSSTSRLAAHPAFGWLHDRGNDAQACSPSEVWGSLLDWGRYGTPCGAC